MNREFLRRHPDAFSHLFAHFFLSERLRRLQRNQAPQHYRRRSPCFLWLLLMCCHFRAFAERHCARFLKASCRTHRANDACNFPAHFLPLSGLTRAKERKASLARIHVEVGTDAVGAIYAGDAAQTTADLLRHHVIPPVAKSVGQAAAEVIPALTLGITAAPSWWNGMGGWCS